MKKLSEIFLLKEDARKITVELDFDEWDLIKSVLEKEKDPIAKDVLSKLSPQTKPKGVDPFADTGAHDSSGIRKTASLSNPLSSPAKALSNTGNSDATGKVKPGMEDPGKQLRSTQRLINPSGLEKKPAHGLYKQPGETQQQFQDRMKKFTDKLGALQSKDDDMADWDDEDSIAEPQTKVLPLSGGKKK